MATTVAASRKHVELSLELKRKLIQEHEHGVPFTLLGKKYHIATSTAANIWRKKDFFLRSRMSGSRKRCNDRSKYKIVNQVTALFVKSMLERNHKIDGEVIKRFARTAAAQCNFKDFHGSNGWLDSFKKRENVCWVRRRGERSAAAVAVASSMIHHTQQQSLHHQQQAHLSGGPCGSRPDSPNLSAAAAAAAVAATSAAQQGQHRHSPPAQQWAPDSAGPDALEPTTGGGHCSRCSVAAAAAAVAALNSSDSIHERDHEIEDWFHGIPFLCQFFEEYQSMHQQAVGAEPGSASSNAASSCAGGGGGSGNGSSGGNGIMAAVAATRPATTNGSSVCSSSSSSSSSSACSAASTTCSTASAPARPPNSSAALASGASNNCNMAGSLGAQRSASQHQQLVPVRSLSDAHELMETSFRPSSSLADLQSVAAASGCGGALQRTISSEMLSSQQLHDLNKNVAVGGDHQQQQQQQQQGYETMSYTTTTTTNETKVFQLHQSTNNSPIQSVADFATGLADPAATNGSDTDQLMDFKFTPSAEQDVAGSQQQQQQQSCHLSQRHRNDSSHQMDQMNCLMAAGKQQVVAVGGGGAPCGCQSADCQLQQQQQQQHSRLTNSTSNPHQHNHHHQNQQQQRHQSCAIVSSDYNSDDPDQFYLGARYIPQDEAQSADDILYQDEVSDHNDCCSDHYDLPPGGSNSHNNNTSSSSQMNDHHYQTDLDNNGGGGTCYMGEYEYENIAIIRHYPVPMPPNAGNNSNNNNSSSNSSNNSNNNNSQASNNHLSNQQVATSQALNNQAAADEQGSCFPQAGERGAGGGGDQHQAAIQQQQRQGATCQIGAAANCAQQQQQQQQQGFIPSSATSSPGGCGAGGHNLGAPSAGAANDYRPDPAAAARNDYSALMHGDPHEQMIEHADHEEHNLLHNALMRSPEKLKLIDSIITLLNYASNYNSKMLGPLLEIKRCIERDLEVVLSDTSANTGSINTTHHHHTHSSSAGCCMANGTGNRHHQQQHSRELQEAADRQQQQQALSHKSSHDNLNLVD